LLFPVLAAFAGGPGGYQFPIAGHLYFRSSDSNVPAASNASHSNPGSLYALDLAGACLGAILLSAYLIPVFGFAKTAVAIAAVNIAPAMLFAFALLAARRS
jgi:predicted membrane-bound spermidine synthase